MLNPTITTPKCEIIAQTPETHQHYFGFHDISPWSEDDDQMVLLRVGNDLKETPTAADIAEICLWRPGFDVPLPIGSTRAFNWQQGARVRWLPGKGRTVMVNDLESGMPITRFYNVDESVWTGAVPAVYATHPSGNFGLAPDWFRLAKWWRDYSYDLPMRSDVGLSQPGDLRRVNFETGRDNVIVPVALVRELCQQSVSASESDFISHATFNPSGSRFCFMYRRFSDDGALFSFFLACNSDGSDLRVLAREKCSHFDWIDDDRLILWTRKLPGKAAALRSSGLTKRFPFKQMVRIIRKLNPRMKQSLFSEMYYELDYRMPGEFKPFAPGVLEQDGHPMFSPDRRWMVTDTYAFEGHQPLILVEMETQARSDIVSFPVHPEFRKPALKCDLHPRLNRRGTMICVDSAHTGQRQLYVVDIEKFIRKGN
jgi:hypothetical protein